MTKQEYDELRQRAIAILESSMPHNDASKIVDFGNSRILLMDEIVGHVTSKANRIDGKYVYDDSLVKEAIGKALLLCMHL